MRSALNRSASSHGTRSSAASRRARICGWTSRSDVRRTGGRCTALAQTSPRLAGWAGSPFTLATRPAWTCTRSPHPTPQYGHIVDRQPGSSAAPASGGIMSLLLEEGHDRVPEPEIVRSPEQLVAPARPGEGHVEDPSDRRRGTAGHHDDPIGELKGFVHVVGDHDDGLAPGLPERDQLILQIHPRQRVEERERLVEQEEPRPEREGPRDAGSLLHPRRQLARVAPALPAEPDRRQIGLDVAIGRGRNPVAGEPDVVAHRYPWQERRRLKDHAAIGARAVDLTPADDDAPGARRREAHQDREHGRLAAAGMAEQADELALVDVQREVAHDDRL